MQLARLLLVAGCLVVRGDVARADDVLQPAPIERPGLPPARTAAEVATVLAGSEKVDTAKAKPLRILLLASDKDHDLNEHDYPLWQKRWEKLLALAPNVKVSTASIWPSAEDFKSADVIVGYSSNPGWTPERAEQLEAFQVRGGGLVLLHWAVNGGRAPEVLAKHIGLAWGSGSKTRHGPLDVTFHAESKHPVVRNFTKAHFVDESYWQLVGDPGQIQVLATTEEDGQPRPLLWTHEHAKGRVVGSILGHYTWTFDDPLYRLLILRAIAWTAGEPVDRFNDLVTVGARVQ
jgi:type 1 glutamine amidotransferase